MEVFSVSVRNAGPGLSLVNFRHCLSVITVLLVFMVFKMQEFHHKVTIIFIIINCFQLLHFCFGNASSMETQKFWK